MGVKKSRTLFLETFIHSENIIMNITIKEKKNIVIEEKSVDS
jgi:hypothetical protein